MEVFTYSLISTYVLLLCSKHARLLVASSSMSALLHTYLVGLEALDVFLSESTCTAFLYVRSDNTGSDVCASSECPGETAFAQARLCSPCSHNKLVKSFVLLVGMCFKYFLRFCAQRRNNFVPEEAAFGSISK